MDDDYDPLFQVVTNRTTPISVRDLHAQLLTTEQRIEARKAELRGNQGGFQSANASYRSQGRTGGRPDYRSQTRGIHRAQTSLLGHRILVVAHTLVEDRDLATVAAVTTAATAEMVTAAHARLVKEAGADLSARSVTGLGTRHLAASKGSSRTTSASTMMADTWSARLLQQLLMVMAKLVLTMLILAGTWTLG
jgi:hypothetical protein